MIKKHKKVEKSLKKGLQFIKKCAIMEKVKQVAMMQVWSDLYKKKGSEELYEVAL